MSRHDETPRVPVGAERPDLLTTFDEAERVNPYTLAGRWADMTARPIRVPAEVAKRHGFEVRTLAHEVDELATVAALRKWFDRCVPGQIHRVLLAGGGVDAAAAACGLPPAEMAEVWRAWSTGQRHLQQQMPELPDHTAEYDAVEAMFDDLAASNTAAHEQATQPADVADTDGW